MNTDRHRKIAKWLFIVWAITYVLANIALRVVSFANNESVIPELFGLEHIITILLVVFWFIPLLLGIRRHSKISGMKPANIAATIFLVHHSFWAVGNIIAFFVK